MRHHGVDCFQGWLVVRGRQKTVRCRRETWDEVCGVIVFFADVLIIVVVSDGPSWLRWWRPAIVDVSHQTTCYRNTIVDIDPRRMRKALARYAEPRYRPEVSTTSHRPRACAYFTSTSAWSADEV